MLRNVDGLFLDKCHAGSFAGGHLQTWPRSLSGSGRLDTRGRQEHGAVFREFSGLQPPSLRGIARKLVRILFPFRRWRGETLGKQSTSVQ